jgi:poly [ADP-ribose] polymerase 2/3/4
VKWKDAGKALNNEELLGCHMPDGPGQDAMIPGVYLQYNEVSPSYDIDDIELLLILVAATSTSFTIHLKFA